MSRLFLGLVSAAALLATSLNALPSSGRSEPPGITQPDEDPDEDGLTNQEEAEIRGANPNDPDTDGDGLEDGAEAFPTSDILMYPRHPEHTAYAVVDLGPDGPGTRVVDLNNNNQVLDGSGRIWTQGTWGEPLSEGAVRINDAGQILAYRSSGVMTKFYPDRPDPDTQEPGVYGTEEHSWAYLDNTPLYSAHDNDDEAEVKDNAWSWGASLNNSGQVVGMTTLGGGYGDEATRAFRWQGGEMEILPDFGIPSSETTVENQALLINDSGAIAGIAHTDTSATGYEAYLDQGGERTLLGMFAPVALNNSNHVLLSHSVTSPDTPSLHVPGAGTQDLVAIFGRGVGVGLIKRAFNSRGQMLLGGALASNSRRLPTGPPGWSFTPKALNDSGLILGYGAYASQDARNLLLVPITITFEPVGGNDNISDNKKKVLDGSGGLRDEWMPGHGKRIFPDAKNPGENRRDSANVKVHTGMPNTKVYLLALDVDDPTPQEVDTDPNSGQTNIIDANDEHVLPGAGEDNRSGRPDFTPQGSALIECVTDENGLAKISGALPRLRVGMNAGDNYRVAVTVLTPDGLESLQTGAKDDVGYVGPSDEQPLGFNGVVGPMLTVWRRIHVEQDTMVAPPATKPAPDHQVATNGVWGTTPQGSGTITTLTCDVSQSVAADFYAGGRVVAGNTDYWLKEIGAHGAGTRLTLKFSGTLSDADKEAIGTSAIQLYDDDDKPLPSEWPSLLPYQGLINNEIKAAFQVAYIDLTDQPTTYSSADVPFVLNMPESRYTLGSEAPSKASIPSSNDYWGCTLVAGYQDFASGGDLDPSDDQSGGLASTLTVNSRGVSVIFLEMIRERAPASKTAIDNDLFQKLLWQVVAHEIGHNAPSGFLSDDHDEGGIMDPEILGGDGIRFMPLSIKRFRDADRWRK